MLTDIDADYVIKVLPKVARTMPSAHRQSEIWPEKAQWRRQTMVGYCP
jgi:hypothetical protein